MITPKNSRIILTGETSPADALAIASVASGMGHHFVRARSPEAALDGVDKAGAALVLASESLSASEIESLVSGLEKLKNRPPVVVLSGHRASGSAALPGVYGRVSLPLNPEHLASTLCRAMEEGRLQARLNFFRRLILMAGLLIPLSLISGMLLAMP